MVGSLTGCIRLYTYRVYGCFASAQCIQCCVPVPSLNSALKPATNTRLLIEREPELHVACYRTGHWHVHRGTIASSRLSFGGFAELSRLWAGDPPRARRSMRDTGLRYMYLNILRGDCQKTVAHNALK